MAKPYRQKQKINKKIKAVVEQYLDAVSKEGMPIRSAYIFGSQIRSAGRGGSDIDVCIVSSALQKNWWRESMKLRAIRRQVDLRIEPHGFSPEDFVPEHPLVWEIQQHGVRVR